MLFIVLSRTFLVFVIFTLLFSSNYSHSFSENNSGSKTIDNKKVETSNNQQNNEDISSEKSSLLKGAKLKKYFSDNTLIVKKNDQELKYIFQKKEYTLYINNSETEKGKWKIKGILQNYIELKPNSNKQYYFQKFSNSKEVLRFEEIINAKNFLNKLKSKEIGKKNQPLEKYKIISSLNKEPIIKKKKTASDKAKSKSYTVIKEDGAVGSKKIKYDYEFKGCQSYNAKNIPFKSIDIKIDSHNQEFNSSVIIYNFDGSQKKIKKTAKKQKENFYRIAIAEGMGAYYWHKFNINNGRFVTEYYIKPKNDIFAMGQLSYQVFGYCNEIIKDQKQIKVDIAAIQKQYPQKNISRVANSNIRSGASYNNVPRGSYNNTVRNRCYASGKNIADPLASKLVSKLFKTKENKMHSADPACANMASTLSVEARQKMRNAGIATVTQYYFYESLIYYNEGLELLLRAFDKNVEADKLKNEREYLQRGGIGTGKDNKFGKFVTRNASFDVSGLISSTVQLKSEGSGYYEKAMPKIASAAYSMTNYIIVVAHSLDKMDKSADGINNVLNVIGAASTVPKLPEYLKTLYSASKLVFNGAKDRKIKDKGNSQKALKDLGFL